MTISCQAILFDMDGTLLDSTECSDVTWKAWAEERGADFEKIRAVHHGRRPEETIAIVAPHLNAVDEAVAIYESQGRATFGIRPIPGANEFYGSLRDGSFGVVTAATQEILEHRFRLVGLKPPKVCVTAKMLKNGKPDPEGYLKAAALVGVDPKNCVVFEDAPAGLIAARRAGMRSVAVLTNYTAAQLRDELREDYEPVVTIADYLGVRRAAEGFWVSR